MEERTDVMTDYQIRTLLNMIITIVDKEENKEDLKKRLIEIRDGKVFDEKSPGFRENYPQNQ